MERKEIVEKGVPTRVGIAAGMATEQIAVGKKAVLSTVNLQKAGNHMGRSPKLMQKGPRKPMLPLRLL